jgi:1-acyl-sn-glycerol-3-phosphate acyltransferase
LARDSVELLSPLLDAIDQAMAEQKLHDPSQRDPELVAQALPWLKGINRYFGAEVRGWENVPRGEPFLVVGNHSGGLLTVDAAPFMARWIEMRGSEAPLFGLGYDLLFAYPAMGRLLPKLGLLPASRDNARRALDKGGAVMVFPGGDHEVFRPWTERHHVDFGGHTGFIELAIEAGVRVVPMTIHGSHESTFVLTRGEQIARLLGIDRLHVKVFPIIWNIPFGITPAFVPSLPLPSKITVQLGTPIDWSHYGPEQADDAEVRQACYDEITGIMEQALCDLAAERPHPVRSRLDEARPGKALQRAVRFLRRRSSGRTRSRSG